MSKIPFILAATPVAVLALAACGHTTNEVVTPVPVVTAAPATAPTVIVANAPPPAPQVEARPPAPGSGYVWQDGYWTVRNGQYEWVPGHWVTSRAGHTRVPRRGELDGQGTTLQGGPN